MKIEIKHRRTGAVLWSGEANNLKDGLVAAVKSGADLWGANLGGVDLGGASLKGASLEGANLEGAYLRDANLADANLAGANLAGANLDDASLVGAYLMDANLEGASLEGANLEGASLGGANLKGANLRGITGYAQSHDIFAQLIRNNLLKFTIHEQEMAFRVVGLRLCWDSIRKEYGKKIVSVFKKLSELGWDEYLFEWKEQEKKVRGR